MGWHQTWSKPGALLHRNRPFDPLCAKHGQIQFQIAGVFFFAHEWLVYYLLDFGPTEYFSTWRDSRSVERLKGHLVKRAPLNVSISEAMLLFDLQNAIANASTLAEVEKLKGMLQAGQIPGRDRKTGELRA